MKIIRFIPLIFFVCSSCISHLRGYKLHISYHNAEGLTTESIVESRGVKIGDVESLELAKEDVLVTVRIKNSVKIPVGSNFEIQAPALIGNKIIAVIPSKNPHEFYLHGDTLIGSDQRENAHIILSKKDSVLIRRFGDSVHNTMKRILNEKK